MSNAIFEVPVAENEPVLSYAPGSPEKAALVEAIKEFKSAESELCMHIGGEKIATNDRVRIHPPHEIGHTLGYFHRGDASHVEKAIEAALEAKPAWEAMPWQDRAAIFLKAADLLAGPFRARMNAATVLGQSKNAFQAEIDAVAEFCDFLRYNAQFLTDMYMQQPESSAGVWNRLEYRPLEGFIFALTPFNFTSIAGNLCAAPALMGNTIVWKPSETQIFSANVIMEVFDAAGLPPGVINLIFVDGPTAGDVIFNHHEFTGLHFTGSTGVFRMLWRKIANNLEKYRSFPRVVGETGGKDFVMAHHSADAEQLAVGLVRGAFEFQGQKCSAASRAYIPESLWPGVKARMQKDIASMKMGSPEDFGNFVNAVIDEKSFDKIAAYLTSANADPNVEVVAGGTFDKSEGYFIAPTVLKATDPKYTTMCEELFGPVLTVFVYPDDEYEKTLELLDSTSEFALTGSIFAKDRYAVIKANEVLKHSAGNFYINDKPSGAVVGQQPFGGARGSGTNDKAGSILNLYRWVSPRTIKETFNAPRDYRYPFLGE